MVQAIPTQQRLYLHDRGYTYFTLEIQDLVDITDFVALRRVCHA